METILKANRIPFTGRDLATDEKARMLWGRRSGKDAQGRVRKLPGLVQEGLVIGVSIRNPSNPISRSQSESKQQQLTNTQDVVEIEDWNEYGELKQHVKIVGTHNLVGPAKPLLKKNQAASQLSGKSTTSTIPGSKSTAPTASKTSTPIAAQATKPSGSPALAPRLAEEVKEKQNATIGITSAMREMALEASQKVKDLRKKGTEATITASSTATSVASTAAATVGGVATTATNTAQVVLPETLGRKPEPTVPEEKVAEKAEEELKNERIAPDGAVKSEKIEDKSAASESAGSSTPPSSSLKTAPASDDALASKRVKICEPVKSEKKEKNSTNSVNEKASAQTETGAWVPTDINPPIRSHRGSEVEEAPRDEVRRIERELVIAEGNEDDNEDDDEDAVVNDDKNEEPVKEEEREKKGDVMNEEVLASSQSDEKENRKVEEVIETVVDKEGKVPQPKNDYASLYEL